jgi:riboflavin biosynthesis pyrimidine reductase
MGTHEESDKSRIAKKQVDRIKEKIKVIKTGTGTAGAHDPKHQERKYKGQHRAQ